MSFLSGGGSFNSSRTSYVIFGYSQPFRLIWAQKLLVLNHQTIPGQIACDRCLQKYWLCCGISGSELWLSQFQNRPDPSRYHYTLGIWGFPFPFHCSISVLLADKGQTEIQIAFQMGRLSKRHIWSPWSWYYWLLRVDASEVVIVVGALSNSLHMESPWPGAYLVTQSILSRIGTTD